MNIVQKAQLIESGRKPNIDPHVFYRFDQHFDPIGPTDFKVDTLYRVQVTFGASFVYSPEEKMALLDGVHHCLKNLTHIVYGDVLKALDRIESRVYNRATREELLGEISKLREQLLEVNPDAIEKV